MARGHGRDRVLVSGAVDPRLVETLRAYGRGAGYEPEIFAVTDGRGGAPDVGPDVAAVIVQHPNVYGILEPVRDLFGRAHDGGARAIQVFDPLSLGVLAPPGELGADIAVAEGQALGNHLNYGGPYLGLIAARLDDVRKMPGRICGETVDVDGKVGYVLTLQAREQHIRREKANSNICTNQTLMAVAATIYLGWLGPAGLAELGRQCASKAAYTAERLTAIDGVDLLHPGAPFFKEFAVTTAAVRDRRARRARRARVPGGRAARRRRGPRARRRGHREAVARRDRPVRAGVRGGARVIGAPIRRQDPAVGGGHDQGPVEAGPLRVRVRAARRPGGVDPGRGSAPDRSRAARGLRDRPGAPLHAPVADELRRGHRLLPAGLVHDEVQPEGRRDRRGAPGVPADAPVAARSDGPGRARDALATRAGALRDHRDGARHAAAARRRVRGDDRSADDAGVPRRARGRTDEGHHPGLGARDEPGQRAPRRVPGGAGTVGRARLWST